MNLSSRVHTLLFTVLVGSFLAALPAVAEDAPPPVSEISGTWDFAVASPAGAGNPVFTFQQNGEKLTGKYQGYFGEAPVTGTIKDAQIQFEFKVNVDGQDMTIKYAGTVSGATMKGTVNFGSFDDGTFTATKKPAAK